MRVFGPLNSGYSTGMMSYVEDAGQWGAERELAEGYLNNMGAAYGDEDNWADFEPGLFSAALARTDVIIQPRQSNTWGPLSLDHVYEFTGGLSLAVREVTGKEPDAMMADYRNSRSHRMQDARQALAVETRATILNPTFIRERMNGGEGTAQMFGELFRNVFGWSVTRSSMLDPQLYDDLYRLYFEDSEGLGIRDYLEETNPAAFTSMTQVLLDCASKGYWKPDIARLQQLKALRAQQLQVVEGPSDEVVLREERLTPQAPQPALQRYAGWVGAVLALVLFGLLILLLRHKRS